MQQKIEDQYIEFAPHMTMAEIVQLAAFHLLNNGLDGFEFDIPGESEDGRKIVLHFECNVQLAG